MIDVVYEDNQILVVVKPQNIPTQADESKDKDLLTMCKEYIKEKYNKPGEVYLGMVHRLDRPTGGLIVFARTSKSAGRLSEAIKEHTFKKEYLTVVDGRPQFDKGSLVDYLKKDNVNNIVNIVPMSEQDAKKAELSYTMKSTTGELTLLQIALKTGRSHQIRVQMKGIKTPVHGDTKYGKPSKEKKLALWAYKLEFVHPTTKKVMKFTSYPNIEEYPWSVFGNLVETL